MVQDRNILSAVSLGLNAPAWGWPRGIGLRWALPVATTIHDPGINLQGQPRGWPAAGYRIYRSSSKAAIRTTCADLLALNLSGISLTAPLALGQTHVTADWSPRAQTGRAADSIAAAGACLLTCHAVNIGLSLRFTMEGEKQHRPTGEVEYRAYDKSGRLLAAKKLVLHGSRNVAIAEPDVRLVELEFSVGVVLAEVCIMQMAAKPSGQLIATVKPITNVATILTTVPTSRRNGTNWADFASCLSKAIADVDDRLPDTTATASGTAASGMPTVDLLVLLSVDPVIANLMGLLWWDDSALPGASYVYWIEASWNGVDYLWPVGPVAEQVPAPFELPASIGFSAWALPASLTADSSGITGQPCTAAGVNWTASFSTNSVSDTITARYRVARKSVPFGTPSATIATELADLASYATVPGGDLIATETALPYRLRDAGFPEGNLGWSLTGFDLFGRPSQTITTGPVEIWDRMPPPPPSRLRAAWLDRNILGSTPASLRDPAITPEHEAWLTANSTVATAIYAGFDWPPTSAATAPTVREFRLYAQAAASATRLQTQVASANAVANHPEWTDCILSAALPAARASLVGGVLSDGRASFTIVEVAAATETANRVRVANLQKPRRIAVTPSSDPPGTSTVTASSDPPDWVTPTAGNNALVTANLKLAQYWAERLAILPKVAPLATTIRAVTGDVTSGDVRNVSMDLAAVIAHPDPTHGVYVEGGYLQAGNAVYVASLVTNDASRTLPMDRTRLVIALSSTDTTAFAPGEAVTYFPGLGCYLAHASYRGASELRKYALITASAANDSHAPDAVDDAVHGGDVRWREAGNPLHGYESALASPATILDINRVPPPAPPAPEPPDMASWPDASGMASFTLQWTPQSGARYVVMRALDQALYAGDRKLRASAGSGYGSDETGETGNLASLTSPTTYPDSPRPGSPDYEAVYLANPGLLRRIASLAGNAGAFVARMPKPLGVDDCTGAMPPATFTSVAGTDLITKPGLWYDERTGKLVFTDTVGGIGTSRYFYRVLAVDQIGNRSTLGKSTPPVELRVKVAPRTPVLDRARLGDCAVTVLWNAPADNSVDRYLVYRSSDPSDLGSLDLLVPDSIDSPSVYPLDSSDGYATDGYFAPPAGAAPLDGARWGWMKTDLPPSDLYVVVVAEKDMLNGAPLRSPPSRPLRIRPKEYSPPEAPEVVSLTRTGTTATVQYDLDRPWHSVVIEMRAGAAKTWTSVMPFTVPSSLPYTYNFTVDAAARYSVRLRARNGEGVLSTPVIGTLA